MIHRIRRGDRRRLVDVNKGPHALAGGIGNPCETFIDQFARGGASSVEIGGEAGECRMVRHGFLVDFLWRHLSSEASLVFKSVHGCSKMYPAICRGADYLR